MRSSADASIAFFDIFDLPLAHSRGFSFLPGRDQVVAHWQSAIRHIDRKLMIAKHACRILRWVPNVLAVFACNTVAIGNANDESDIDVLILVRDKRLWLTRLLVTTVISAAGLRRHGKKIRDRICLSFYLTPSAFNVSRIAYHQDIYLAYWLRTLIPLYDPKQLFDRLQTENHWADTIAPPNAQSYRAAPRIRTMPTRFSQAWQRFFERAWGGAYGDLLEKNAKAIQRARMDHNAKSREQRGGSAVVITDTMMKFHENDRREQYREKWKKRCEGLGFRG